MGDIKLNLIRILYEFWRKQSEREKFMQFAFHDFLFLDLKVENFSYHDGNTRRCERERKFFGKWDEEMRKKLYWNDVNNASDSLEWSCAISMKKALLIFLLFCVSFFLRNVFHRTLWQLEKIYGECLSSRDNKRHHNLKAFFPFDNKRDECDDVMHRGAISSGLRETTVTNTTVKSCAKQLTARSFRKFGIWIKNGKLFALSFVFIISKAL